MRTLAGIAGALTLLGAALTPATAPAATASIIGGTPAEAGTFPELAFIADVRGESTGWCTGTVVAANVVLTAAHCAEDSESGEVRAPSGYTVVTGNVDWASSPRQVSGVSQVVVYPGYSRTELAGDAALLILTTPTTAPAITLAAYPSDSARLQGGASATMAGWGETLPEQGKPSGTLSWAATTVQQTSYCEANAPPFHAGSEICTIDPPSDETGICFGDSGGPLIAHDPSGAGDMELGVTSHIYGDCLTDRPSVFTRADVIAPWVNEWITAARTVPEPAPTPAPKPTPTPPAPANTAVLVTSPVPPNTPGYYLTGPSRTRRVVIHVGGDGRHIVAISIKMPARCRHGHSQPLEESAGNITITNHIARETLALKAGRETEPGRITVFLRFTASAGLEGRLRAHIRFRSPRVGLCTGIYSFTART